MQFNMPNVPPISLRSVVIFVGTVIIFGAVLFGIKEGKVEARDEKRVEDVRRIREALAIYFDYNQKYPESFEGQPRNLSSYLEFWPQVPTPADGTCTAEVNRYVYQQTDNGEAYLLTFCLGGDSGEYGAGYYEVKP